MARRKRRSDHRKEVRRPDERPLGPGLLGVAWVVGGAVILLAVLFALLLMGARPAAAQGLADFDYENLSFRGVMLEGGRVFPSGVEPAASFGFRADLGFLGPGVRVTAGLSRWSSSLRRSEVRALEERVEDLVQQETGSRPTVNLGRITLSDVALSSDAHMVWRVPPGFLTYAGAGGSAHVLRGGGTAIEDTFIQDLLNSVRAGVNVHAGVEVPLARQFRVVGETRYEFLQSFSYLQVRIGGQFMWGGWASGEEG
jgi:hypothetical protein